MKQFTTVNDIGDLGAAVAEALAIKKDRFAYRVFPATLQRKKYF